MPKISVIVPVYNSEYELKDCLDSLVEQTEKDIEVLIIDDGSTDNSLAVALEYQKQYSNIKVYKNAKNMGQSVARNKGLELAQGEYITFLDSDDYINPEMYEELYQAAINNNRPALITTGLVFVKGNEYRTGDLSFIAKASISTIQPLESPNSIFLESPSLGNKLFRNDTAKNYRLLNVSAWEDIAFSLTRFLEADKVIVKPTANYFYRRDLSRGVSSKNLKENDKITDIFVVADEIEQELKRSGKYHFFAPQIRSLQIAICLQRIDEINNWENKEIKEKVKHMIFSTVYQKYGTLEGIDIGLISSKTGVQSIDEYKDYLDKEKDQRV